VVARTGTVAASLCWHHFLPPEEEANK